MAAFKVALANLLVQVPWINITLSSSGSILKATLSSQDIIPGRFKAHELVGVVLSGHQPSLFDIENLSIVCPSSLNKYKFCFVLSTVIPYVSSNRLFASHDFLAPEVKLIEDIPVLVPPKTDHLLINKVSPTIAKAFGCPSISHFLTHSPVSEFILTTCCLQKSVE